jgi:acetyl-CoA carboxylase carboxyl transferase subunit alpha
MQYFDFENKVRELEEKIKKLEISSENVSELSRIKEIGLLKKELDETIQATYGNLTRWQKVQLSRHSDRPQAMDYINNLMEDFTELHGDRYCGDDQAIVGGFAHFEGESVMCIGHQKGRSMKEKQFRNFGMPGPEGYRKALRLMELAEKFNKPIIIFIDTPGASTGLDAEEQGQGMALARNLEKMLGLSVPIISVIIGEASGGGALALAIADKVLMMEYTWYSATSPEHSASVLWRNWESKVIAAEKLMLTASDMFNFGFIDGVINEPCCGAHRHPEEAYDNVRKAIVKNMAEIRNSLPEQRVAKRTEIFIHFGDFEEI